MVKSEKLTRYFQTHAGKAIKTLGLFSKSGKPKEHHLFRVEIKKMRAVLAILKKHPADGKLRSMFSPVKMVFKQAGKIRTYDVNMKLISKFLEADDPLLLKSKSSREKSMKSLVATLKKQQLAIKKSIALICQHLFDVEDFFIIERIEKKLERIEKEFVRKKLRTDRLHERRKQVKYILYVHELLPRPAIDELRIDKKYLDTIQHEIGVWHDLELSHKIFMESKSTDPDLIKEVWKDKRNQEAKIKKLTKNFKKEARLSAK